MTTDDTGGRSSKYWGERADECRTMADGMRDGFAEKMMREIATLYDQLTERAAKAEARAKVSGSN